MYLIFKSKYQDNDISANAIAIWTRSPYIHASIVFNNGLVAGSWKDGVQWKTKQEVIKDDKYFIYYKLNSYENEEQAIKWFESQIGKKFDWTAIVFTEFLPLGIENKDQWFCAEITVKLLQILYPDSIFSKLEPSHTSPGKLLKFVERFGNKL